MENNNIFGGLKSGLKIWKICSLVLILWFPVLYLLGIATPVQNVSGLGDFTFLVAIFVVFWLLMALILGLVHVRKANTPNIMVLALLGWIVLIIISLFSSWMALDDTHSSNIKPETLTWFWLNYLLILMTDIGMIIYNNRNETNNLPAIGKQLIVGLVLFLLIGSGIYVYFNNDTQNSLPENIYAIKNEISKKTQGWNEYNKNGIRFKYPKDYIISYDTPPKNWAETENIAHSHCCQLFYIDLSPLNDKSYLSQKKITVVIWNNPRKISSAVDWWLTTFKGGKPVPVTIGGLQAARFDYRGFSTWIPYKNRMINVIISEPPGERLVSLEKIYNTIIESFIATSGQ